MRILETLTTRRLILRRPRLEDAEAIFSRYSGDAEVTRYLGWPRHQTVDDARSFVAFSDSVWSRWSAGPYLMESRHQATLLGSAGFDFIDVAHATTGYVLARDAWGQGYATEALNALMELAPELGISELSAFCHPLHRASIRVLEKCGFDARGTVADIFVLPNLHSGKHDVLQFTKTILGDSSP